MQVYEKVGEYIRTHHLKQTSIAKAAGLSVNTFCAILHGRRKMYADDLRAICLAIGVSADTFIPTASGRNDHD